MKGGLEVHLNETDKKLFSNTKKCLIQIVFDYLYIKSYNLKLKKVAKTNSLYN